ncbi:ras-related protein Rab-39A isoform X2 [Meles meles]|uniref:ras-related protein Rab-39A isoform X2 n=1 Tax=Meles meles TaxID=9662 RepID=UPI001E69EB53|nr:ras-related protein Rab-39A isoform X2 [Meles meles]
METIWIYQFRLIVIGDSTVGKSCLLHRFTQGRFPGLRSPACDPTVGVDFFSRLLEIEPGKRIKLQLWDTAGQERFRSITRSYYRNSVGGFLVFDITNRRSFEHVKDWLEEAKMHVQPFRIVFLLVGHKCDLASRRQVTREEAENLSADCGGEAQKRVLLLTSDRPKNDGGETGGHLRISTDINGRTVTRKRFPPAFALLWKVFNSDRYASLLHYHTGCLAQLSGNTDNFFLKLERLQNYSHSHFVSV